MREGPEHLILNQTSVGKLATIDDHVGVAVGIQNCKWSPLALTGQVELKFEFGVGRAHVFITQSAVSGLGPRLHLARGPIDVLLAR